VEANDWANLLNMTELRKLTHTVAIGSRDVQPTTGFRTDYAPLTDQWYYVQTSPVGAVSGPGPTTNPMNTVTPANAILERGEDGSVVDLDSYITKSIQLYREMLMTAKLSVIPGGEAEEKGDEKAALPKRIRSKHRISKN
jgi:hypothetical protein